MNEPLNITETDDGVRLSLRVIPRASSTKLDGVHDGAVRVRLNAPPVDGAANKSLCEYLAKTFDLRKRDVEVVRGERSREKTVVLRGISRSNVEQVLSTLL
jgi:uncharacterized protein